MWSKPIPQVTSEQDRVHKENSVLQKIGDVIYRKIELKVLDREHRLQDDILNDIRQQKSDPNAAIIRATEGIKLLKEIGPIAQRDTNKLLAGKLTKESAELQYKDERIFSAKVPEHLKPVLTANGCQRNICLFQKLIEITNHVDKDIALNIGEGFPTIGPAPITNLWPKRETPDPEEGESVWQDNEANRKIIKNVADFYALAITLKKKKPTLEDEILDHIIEEIEGDIKKGRYREISTELLKVQPMLAFGVRQKNKIRLIIDERIKNEHSTLTEKLILKGTSHLIEAIRAFHAEPGMESNESLLPGTQRAKAAYKSMLEELNEWNSREKKSEDLKVEGLPSNIEQAIRRKNKGRFIRERTGRGPAAFLRDFKKAYYQVGCIAPHENIIQAYDNMIAKWRYFEAVSLTMGNTHSVTSWCRIAEAAEYFSRKIGGLIQFIYIDDSTTMAVNEEVATKQMEFLDCLNEQLGLEISDKPEARQDSMNNDKMMILGLEYSFKKEETVIEVPEQKKEKIRSLCKKIIDDLKKSKAIQHDIQVLVGNLVYSLYSSGERSGNAVLHGIYPWFDPGFFDRWVRNRDKKRNLIRTLYYIIEVTDEIKPIRINGQSAIREVVHLFTDASSDGGPNGKAGLGAALLDAKGKWHVTTAEVETERIDILELKGVAFALDTFNIRNKDVVCHVDNAGDVYALIRGVHKTHRGSFLIHEIYKNLIRNNNGIFWDYIKSEANIADFFTRAQKEKLGLEWTGAKISPPIMTIIEKTDNKTEKLKLGDEQVKGLPVPGPWEEKMKEEQKEKQGSTQTNEEVPNLADNADWILWNAHARKIADALIEDEEHTPNLKRRRVEVYEEKAEDIFPTDDLPDESLVKVDAKLRGRRKEETTESKKGI